MLARTLEVSTVPAERRQAERKRVGCPAQLHLTSGIRVCMLMDLSTSGARIQLGDALRVGAEGLLKWQSHEAFCSVVWVADGMVGLMFDRALAPAMLDETLKEEEERRTGPIASVRNIPLGQKRSRLLFGGAATDRASYD